MDLDVNRILGIYKQKVSDLEHELILQQVLCQQLEEELNKLKQDEEEENAN